MQKVARHLQRRFLRHIFNGSLLSAAIFSFRESGISDDDVRNIADLMPNNQSLPAECAIDDIDILSKARRSVDDGKWDLIVDRPHFQVWRRPDVRAGAERESLWMYKVVGSFYDLPATAFFATQLNLDYRKKWDKLVIDLDVVDADQNTGSEVVRWVTHFPYPMYPREYVYVRRACVDTCRRIMVLVSKAVIHPKCPLNDSLVRVDNYESNMVIRPHKDFDEDGFDYVLTYFDDPRSPFPGFAYNWMAKSGVPDFVNKVYHAAKQLHLSNNVEKQLGYEHAIITAHEISR